ncbi:MAG: metal-dependent hydrolase [Candidatus Binatia bacterium]
MSDNKTPEGIVARKVQFEFPPDFKPHWHPTKPEWSQLVNGASVILPYFEPCIIDAIRKATTHITDPALLTEAKAWISQESQHFRQHRRFNEMLIAKGYEQVRELEQQFAHDYGQIPQTKSLKFQVAYAAGTETMALAVGHMMIQQRDYFFRDADPAIASLWLWHLVEEIEHKNVAFDVYQHLYGDYWYRVYGLIYGMVHNFRRLRQAYIVLLKADGLWGKWKTRWAIKKVAFRLLTRMLPQVFLHALPGHDPAKIADPAWMQEWVALYDKGEQGLLKLDTTKVHLSPAAMLPT